MLPRYKRPVFQDIPGYSGLFRDKFEGEGGGIQNSKWKNQNSDAFAEREGRVSQCSPSPQPIGFPSPPPVGCPYCETASRYVVPQEREDRRPAISTSVVSFRLVPLGTAWCRIIFFKTEKGMKKVDWKLWFAVGEAQPVVCAAKCREMPLGVVDPPSLGYSGRHGGMSRRDSLGSAGASPYRDELAREGTRVRSKSPCFRGHSD